MDGNHAEQLGRELMRRQRSGEKLEAGAGKKLIEDAIQAEELEKKCKRLIGTLGEARLLLTVRKYDEAVLKLVEAIQLPILKPAGKPSSGPGGSPGTAAKAGTGNTSGQPAIPGNPAPSTPGASPKR